MGFMTSGAKTLQNRVREAVIDQEIPCLRSPLTCSSSRISMIPQNESVADSDLRVLRSVADWIKTFVAKPHKDLAVGTRVSFAPGPATEDTLARSGADCPAGAWQMLSSSRTVTRDYCCAPNLLTAKTRVTKAIVVVFTDLSRTVQSSTWATFKFSISRDSLMWRMA
jgi:hypothetical protein